MNTQAEAIKIGKILERTRVAIEEINHHETNPVKRVIGTMLATNLLVLSRQWSALVCGEDTEPAGEE